MASTPPLAAGAALAQIFAQKSNDELTRFARLFTTKPPTNKRDLIALLGMQATGPGLPKTLDLAGQPGRQILAAAAHGNGLLRTAQASAPIYPLGHWSGYAYDGERGRQKPSVVLLFFPDGSLMPPPVRNFLTAHLPAPERPLLATLPGNPPGFPVLSDVVTDLELVLETVRAGRVLMTKQGPSAVSLRQCAAKLSCPSSQIKFDGSRLSCFVNLLLTCRWLDSTAVRLIRLRTRVDQAGMKELFAAYMKWPRDELEDLPGLRGCRHEYAPISDPVARRKALVGVLRDCPREAWIDSGEFSRNAAVLDLIEPILQPTALVSIGGHYQGGLDHLGAVGLHAVRDAWVRLVLGCYLAPLGVVEVSCGDLAPLPLVGNRSGDGKLECLSPADCVTAFRLTPLGIWLLGRGAEPVRSVAPTGGWRIQPDASVVGLGERIAPADRVLLDKLGSRLDERSWRLERDQLMAAIASGDEVRTLRAGLATMGGGIVRDPVVRLIAVPRGAAPRSASAPK